MDKKTLRNLLICKRDALEPIDKHNRDYLISKFLIDFVNILNPKIVHTYLPINSEPNFYPFINFLFSQNIKVICPKTLAGRKLEHLELLKPDFLVPGKWGTLHPDGDKKFYDSPDLIIVPALAFNFDNYRLGYGGGFYDQFLNSDQVKNSFLLSVAYDFQLLKNIPLEEHDAKVNLVKLF